MKSVTTLLSAALLSVLPIFSDAARATVATAATAVTAETAVTIVTTVTAAADHEHLLREAELLLESRRKPAEAAPIFREIWNAPDAPRIVKGTALAGLIRCERLLGHRDSARTLLRELLDRYADLPALSGTIAELTAGTEASSFITAIELLGEGQYLDLDRGGVTSIGRRESALAPELSFRNGEVIDCTNSAIEDGGMAAALPWLSPAPWNRIVTSLARTAWYQVLETGNPAVVRYVTRTSGKGPVVPAPRSLFCVGREDRIEIHFTTIRPGAACRIERSGGDSPLFNLVSDGIRSPFVDGDVEPGRRYFYRIREIDAAGSLSLPAETTATTATRGVFSGTARLSLDGRSSVDFLTGVVGRRDGDITLAGRLDDDLTAFTTCLGSPVRHIPVPLGVSLPDPLSAWDRHWAAAHDLSPTRSRSGALMVPPGAAFLVPIRGGGAARCTWTPTGGPDIILEFSVNPDAAHFGCRPELTVRRAAGVALISVVPPEGYDVESVRAVGSDGSAPRTLTVVDGCARDEKMGRDQIVRYTAVAVDRLGRRSAEGSVNLDLLSRKFRTGKFDVERGKGLSFERYWEVPFDEADLFVHAASTRPDPHTFFAARGLFEVHRPGFGDYPINTVFEALAAPAPDFLERQSDFYEIGKSRARPGRSPAMKERLLPDLFFVRTRHGGWAKCAVTERSKRDESPLLLRFAFNAKEPHFVRPGAEAELVAVGSCLVDKAVLDRARAKLEATKKEQVAKIASHAAPQIVTVAGLDERAEIVRDDLAAKENRPVNVVGLFARSHARTLDIANPYLVSTFSFEHATRDDRDVTHNDWDIWYGNGGNKLSCAMGAGARSGIWDLGPIGFDDVDRVHSHASPREIVTQAVADHVYVVHTSDRDSELWSKFQVLAIKPAKWMIIRWAAIDDDRHVRLLGRLPEKVMEGPEARIQLRAGAGGGNANQVSLDGALSIYVDDVSFEPIDMTSSPAMEESSVCYVEGGFIPDGTAWEIDTIEITAQADGDRNGGGEVLVHVGPYTILKIDNPRNGPGPVLYSIDGGARKLDESAKRVEYELSMPIVLVPGDESAVLVEVRNSSLCDLRLRGRFRKIGRGGEPPRNPLAELEVRRLPRFFIDRLRATGNEQRANLAWYRHIAGGKPELRPYLKAIRRVAKHPPYRRAIEAMIEAIE